jgi:hypothetical protein
VEITSLIKTGKLVMNGNEGLAVTLHALVRLAAKQINSMIPFALKFNAAE